MTGEKPGNRRFWDAVLPGRASTVPGSFLVIFWKKTTKTKPNPTLLLVPSTALTPCINPIILSYQVSPPSELLSHPLKPPEPLLSQHFLPNPRLQLLFLLLCILHPLAPSLPLCQGSSPKPSLDPLFPIHHLIAPVSASWVLLQQHLLSRLHFLPPLDLSFSAPHSFSLPVLSRSLFLCAFKDGRRVTGQTRELLFVTVSRAGIDSRSTGL